MGLVTKSRADFAWLNLLLRGGVKPASSTAGLILLCAQTYVGLTIVSGEGAPLLVKNQHAAPSASLPARTPCRCADGGRGGGSVRASPAVSTPGCLFPRLLPSVGRYAELCMLPMR